MTLINTFDLDHDMKTCLCLLAVVSYSYAFGFHGKYHHLSTTTSKRSHRLITKSRLFSSIGSREEGAENFNTRPNIIISNASSLSQKLSYFPKKIVQVSKIYYYLFRSVFIIIYTYLLYDIILERRSTFCCLCILYCPRFDFVSSWI